MKTYTFLLIICLFLAIFIWKFIRTKLFCCYFHKFLSWFWRGRIFILSIQDINYCIRKKKQKISIFTLMLVHYTSSRSSNSSTK